MVLLARRIFHQSKSHESTGYDSGSLCKWTY
nr:MAG TPA: bacteriocin [Caudoviricetes sp.]